MEPPWIEPKVIELPGARARGLALGGAPRGAVLVLSPAGSHPGVAGSVLNRLARCGYESVETEVAPSPPRPGDLPPQVAAALAHLHSWDWAPDQVGVIGYGPGGRAAMAVAARHALGAAVSVAPGWDPPSPVELAPRHWFADLVRTPWLGLLGGAGTDRTAELRAALSRRSPVFTEVVHYPGVSGPFHQDSGVAARHAASFDCWQRTVEWLDLRVAPRLTPSALAWRDSGSRAGPVGDAGDSG